MASSAGATFRWAGVGGGQHQSCDRPQLLPRGLSRALGPGFSRRGEKGHCTRLAFHSKGTLSPPALGSSPTRQSLASCSANCSQGAWPAEPAPARRRWTRTLRSGWRPRGQACLHVALSVEAAASMGTSEQLQYSSRSRQRLAPRTSGSPARSATGTPCAGRSASCAACVQVTDTARHRPRASRAPSGALGEQGEPGPSGEQGYLRSS